MNYAAKDEQLYIEVQRMMVGDFSNYETFYNLSMNYLYKIIFDIVKDYQTTEDLLQETYVRIYNSINQLQDPRAFFAWAGRIATNLTFRHLQKYRLETLAYENEEGELEYFFDRASEDQEAFIPEDILVKNSTRRILTEIIDGLSPEQKITVQYYYFEDMSVGEIAQAMECSTGTVKSRLNYARNAIKNAVLSVEQTQGIRLHSMAAFPLFYYLFREGVENFAFAQTATVGAMGAAGATGIVGTAGYISSMGEIGASEINSAAVGAAGINAGTSVGAAGIGVAGNGVATGTAIATSVGTSIGVKIAVAVTAISLAVGGSVFGMHAYKEKHKDNQSTTMEMTEIATEDITEVSTEIQFELDEDTKTMYYDYIQSTILPQYGMAEVGERTVTVSGECSEKQIFNHYDELFPSTYWYPTEGVIASYIGDLDHDNICDLIILRRRYLLDVNKNKSETFQYDCDFYSIREDGIQLIASSKLNSQYPNMEGLKYPDGTYNMNDTEEQFISVSVVKGQDQDYMVLEYYQNNQWGKHWNANASTIPVYHAYSIFSFENGSLRMMKEFYCVDSSRSQYFEAGDISLQGGVVVDQWNENNGMSFNDRLSDFFSDTQIESIPYVDEFTSVVEKTENADAIFEYKVQTNSIEESTSEYSKTQYGNMTIQYTLNDYSELRERCTTDYKCLEIPEGLWETYAHLVEEHQEFWNYVNESRTTGEYDTIYVETNYPDLKVDSYYVAYSDSSASYSLYDINNDGIPELFLGLESNEYKVVDKTAIFTFVDGKAVMIGGASYRFAMSKPMQNGIIGGWSSSSAFNIEFGFYYLPKFGRQLISLDYIHCDTYLNEPEERTHCDRYGNVTDITEAEQNEIVNSYQDMDLYIYMVSPESIQNLRDGNVEFSSSMQ